MNNKRTIPIRYRMWVWLFLCALYINGKANAQTLPPNRAEQDACQALRLCGNSFTTSYSYQGFGEILDLPYSIKYESSEKNSVWLRLDIIKSGSIVFTISPRDTTDDYDFAVLLLANVSCDRITSGNVIRCNFNNNLQPNIYYTKGIVGINSASNIYCVKSGTNGSPFLRQIDALAGDVYLIMINNVGSGYSGNALGAGFTIDFAGSTAAFFNDGIPAYDSVATVPCGLVKSLSVHLNAPVLCSSIATDGSDFQIMPMAARVANAVGGNCSGSEGYTQDITLTFSNPVSDGVYTLTPRTGSDGNTLISLCDKEQLLSDHIAFTVAAPVLDVGPDTVTCINNRIQLHANAGGNVKIRWAPATYLSSDTVLSPFFIPTDDVTYAVTATSTIRPVCIITDSIHIVVLQGFHLLNQDTMICLGQTIHLQVEGDDRYSYRWTPIDNVSDPDSLNTTVMPDINTTYQLTGSYPGCKDSIQRVKIAVDKWRGITFSKDKDSICVGAAIHFTPDIDTLFADLVWDFGDGTTAVLPDETIQHAYTTAGIFTLQLTAKFLGCPDTTFTDKITIMPAPIVNIGADTAVCFANGSIALARLNKEDEASLLWNTGETSPHIDINQEGVYWLQATNGSCSTTDSIIISTSCYVRIPNAFSPNGDGVNDYFFPRTLLSEGVIGFHMRVFNRWGMLIFEGNSTDGRGWDGMLNGVAQPEGVYVYQIETSFTDNRQKEYRGNITLLR